jgi:hypothetical protein
MQQRDFMKAALAATAASMAPGAVLRQLPAAKKPTVAPGPLPWMDGLDHGDLPAVQTVGMEDVAQPMQSFFTTKQPATLVRLSRVLVPALNGHPGAIEAEVPAFRDFFFGKSLPDVQLLHREGLDDLDGTLESTRLLLNSKIANSGGVLGRYLADQCYGVGVSCSVPGARGKTDVTGLMGGGAVIPRFRNITGRSTNFVGGYGFNVTSQSGPLAPRCFAAYGAELQKQFDLYHNSGLNIGVMGGVLARYENHVRISKDVVDEWGIPAPDFETRYTDNEFNLSRDAMDAAAELAETAGLEVLARNAVPNPPGYSIHELGTCRMGNDAKTSVLNKWNQSHDIKNLFVVDGGAFVSAGWQNPTLTTLALAMRSSEYLAEQIRVGAV